MSPMSGEPLLPSIPKYKKEGGERLDSREYLLAVAKYQKGIIICILANVVAYISILVLGPQSEFVFFPGLVLLFFAIAQVIFVFLLATKVYDNTTGILLGIAALIPCISLILLLIINGKATGILKGNGIYVGLLGADISSI